MARTFGRAMREIKNASADLQNEIKKSGLDVKNDMNLSAIIKKSEEEIQQPLDQVMVDIKETVHYGSANLNEAADNINKSNPSSNNNSQDETEINTTLNKVKSDSEERKTEIKNESNG